MSQDNDNSPDAATDSSPASPPPPPPINTGVPPPPPGGADAAPGSLTNPTKDERNWAMFAHLSGLIVGLVAAGLHLPMLGFLGPLIIYLIKRDESAFIADQAKEALNFFISISIIALGLFLLTLTIILAPLTFLLFIVLAVSALVLTIIAAVRASNGELYRYPLTLRLI